jgi:hypothetical protein
MQISVTSNSCSRGLQPADSRDGGHGQRSCARWPKSEHMKIKECGRKHVCGHNIKAWVVQASSNVVSLNKRPVAVQQSRPTHRYTRRQRRRRPCCVAGVPCRAGVCKRNFFGRVRRTSVGAVNAGTRFRRNDLIIAQRVGPSMLPSRGC